MVNLACLPNSEFIQMIEIDYKLIDIVKLQELGFVPQHKLIGYRGILHPSDMNPQERHSQQNEISGRYLWHKYFLF